MFVSSERLRYNGFVMVDARKKLLTPLLSGCTIVGVENWPKKRLVQILEIHENRFGRILHNGKCERSVRGV